MEESQTWQARYDELRAALSRIGATLGDTHQPAADRAAVAAEFIHTWQQITRHIKRQPLAAANVPPAE